MNFTLLCECDSYSCREKVTVPIEEAQAIKKYFNVVVIVNGCLTGPNSTDVLIEKKQGYSIYKEG